MTLTAAYAFSAACSIPPHSTGKERDTESGLDYFGPRYYASSMGRFMSPDWTAEPDPVPWADFENPQTLNLYSYVQNNPLSRTDPFGHADDPCKTQGLSNCASVTATPDDGPPLATLGLAFGHHFVDQAIVKSSKAVNSLAGQFFSRWRTGPLQNPGLHRGFTTAHRLNSAQIRQIHQGRGKCHE
jgi:RHS repeat-associated protein